VSVYIKGAIGALVVALGIVAWYLSTESSLPANRVPEGYKLIERMEKEGVPEITLPRVAGEAREIKLSEYRGKIVVLNFWASWCTPCVQEFPSMLKLAETMKGDVVVLAVSTDDDRKDIETFMKAFGLPQPHFEVLWDKDKAAMQSYNVSKIPETFLIDKQGRLIRKVLGIENWASEDAIAYFHSLLK
jgi:thiol-disulfide isomerase/thioredoxin